MSFNFVLDIEVYDEYGEGHFAQEKYLVHGYDDVLWTSDLDVAMEFMKDSIRQGEEDGRKSTLRKESKKG